MAYQVFYNTENIRLIFLPSRVRYTECAQGHTFGSLQHKYLNLNLRNQVIKCAELMNV